MWRYLPRDVTFHMTLPTVTNGYIHMHVTHTSHAPQVNKLLQTPAERKAEKEAQERGEGVGEGGAQRMFEFGS